MISKTITSCMLLLALASQANAIKGKATFYTSGHMADGSAYGSHGSVFCAAEGVTLGTVYRVTSLRTHKTMLITVRDHGPLGYGHLDLSCHAFGLISRGGFNRGVEPISYILVKKGKKNKHGKH